MGSACCVAARRRTLQNGTGNEAFHRAIRYSPSWSYRWDNRGRVASDVDYPTAECSRGICRSTGSDTKGGRDMEFSYISDGGSPVEKFQTPTVQVISSDLSKEKSFHTEVKNSVESSAVVYPSVGSTTLVPKVDPLSSQSHPLPDDSIPSKCAYNSPAHPHFRKISDERIPELASPSTSICVGRRSFATSTFSNESGLSSRGGSSDVWSMLAFSELVASSQRDRWSFDSKALDLVHGNVIGSNNRHLASPGVDTSICGVCSKLLTDRSLCSDQKIFGNNELSVVAILVCGHAYHAECLERMTPETEMYDPPCPVCTNEKQPSMVYQKTLKKEAGRKTRNRRSKSHVMDSYLDIEGYDVDLKHRRKSGREEKSAKISYASSSSLKSSFTKPFLKRHLSLGSKSAKPISENDSLSGVPGKKGFWCLSEDKIMAEYRDEFGNLIRRTDEYGNPISTVIDDYGNPIASQAAGVDEYGNPIHSSTTTGTAGYGTTTTGTGTATTGTGYVGEQVPAEQAPKQQHHGLTGMLHRSGSGSSSSSSEDDGQGGRRKKKGLKEKIKEKLPGFHHHKDEQVPATTTTTTSTTTTGAEVPVHHEEHHEKKGIMEKIKEKLPGTHHH